MTEDNINWDLFGPELVVIDYYPLSPAIEDIPMSEDQLAEMAYYDAMAQDLAHQAEKQTRRETRQQAYLRRRGYR